MAQLHLLSPQGFRAAAVYAGIKTKHTPDVALLACAGPVSAAAVFTTNKVVAAPVIVGRDHVAAGKLRGVVVNAGNANACTGKQGMKDARMMCKLAAEMIGGEPEQILPCSTGIIGHLMPMDKIEAGIRDAGQYLGDSLEHALLFADAILTTDTRRKAAAGQVRIGTKTVTVAGVCKGSGMIGPRMSLPTVTGKSLRGKHATMLAYVTTDATISPAMLRRAWAEATDSSFNAVTVDDHCSTNDTAVVLASGAGPAISTAKNLLKFTEGLKDVCQSLAYQIAADGEGATKVVVIKVKLAKSEHDAKLIARTIANSPLVKCAMHGNDPNWGRIVSAAGLCDAAFDPEHATLRLQGTVVFSKGQPVDFDVARVSDSLKSAEVTAELTCRLGKADAMVWTCDLSKEYVTINADYHT